MTHYIMEMSAKALWRFLRDVVRLGVLEINQYCSRIKGLVIDFEISKLEEMSAKGSGINDDALAVIGKRSCQLLHLDLAGRLLECDGERGEGSAAELQSIKGDKFEVMYVIM
jgi:hypothetical protein